MYLKMMGKFTGTALALALLIVCAALFSSNNVVYAKSVSSSDGKSSSESRTTSRTAVNLKSGDWVYSTCLDKNNNLYAAITKYSGSALSVNIPEEFDGVKVKSLSREAFSGNRYVTSVVIPEGVTDIGKYCFRGCVGLTSVKLPSTLKNICEGAFYSCNSLSSVEIPDSVTTLGSYAFSNCWHMTSAKLSSSLDVIGSYAFSNCSMLKSVEFGGKLQSIGSMAFRGCSALEGVTLPDGVVSLGAGVFSGCSSMVSASVGNSLVDLPNEAFRGCSSLESVTLSGALRSVGRSAFEGCSLLKSVTLPESVEKIDMLAFYNCAELEKVHIGKSAKSIGLGAFNGCEKLAEISVSEGNKSFRSDGVKVYSGDGSVLILCPQGASGSASIAEGTEKIADYAFNGCGKISEIKFPAGLKEIGNASFMGCTDVTRLLMPDSMEKIGHLSFGYYFNGKDVKKSDYLNVFGAQGNSPEMYCVTRGIRFTTYNKTMQISTDYVVLSVGETFQLTADFLTSRSGEVMWESSNEAVASVDGGILSGVSPGEAVITVSADGFVEKTVNITVNEKKDELSEEKTPYDKRYMYIGDTLELKSMLDLIVDSLIDPYKFWYSSDPSVAIVNSDGQITALSAGETTITCRLSNGSENYCLVSVTQKPTEFSILAQDNELLIDGVAQIKKSITPASSNDIITWKSNNPGVVTVDDNGNITGVGQGSCEITAETRSGLQSTIKVKCVLPAEEISLALQNRSVYQGKEFNLTASLMPENSQQTVKWSSSDPKVASVNSKGKVTGVSFGTAVISAETESGAHAECEVNVIAKAESLNLDVKKMTMNTGDEKKLNAIILPSYSPETTDVCTWSSTNESVAKVDEEGNVTAIGEGNCIINCRIEGKFISKCQVNVKVPAQSVDIIGEKNDIYIGEVLVLKTKVTPENCTDTMKWSSSNEEIARVTATGSVKGVASGQATITVTATNEVSGDSVIAEYQINVISKAESIKLSRSSISMNVGDTDSLIYSLTPSDSSDIVTWRSTDESVASVREDGLITANSAGSCYIYAETGSEKEARCKVTVN